MLLQYSMHVSQAITSALPKPRQSLRERCRVTLTIQTPSHNQFLKALACDYLFQALEPYARTDRNTSREHRAAATDEAENDHKDGDAEYDDDVFYTPCESPTDFPPNNAHLWNPVDGLYLAFADNDQEVAMLRTYEGEPFSHLVKIVYVPDDNRDPTVDVREVEEKRGHGGMPDILCLTCPQAARALGSTGDMPQRPGRTALSPAQLLAARDFLSLLLPYRCANTPAHIRSMPRAHPSPGDLDTPAMDSPSEPHIRLLVVAPTGRSVDVMSILMCYLAFTSEKPTDVVSAYISEVADCDDVWLGDSPTCTMLGPDGVDYVETVARFP